MNKPKPERAWIIVWDDGTRMVHEDGVPRLFCSRSDAFAAMVEGDDDVLDVEIRPLPAKRRARKKERK